MSTPVIPSLLVVALTAGCAGNGVAAGETAEVPAPGVAAEEPEAPVPERPADQPPAQPPEEPVVVTAEELAEIPAMPISQLLGKTRADIETLFHPSRPDLAPDWVSYNDTLAVRYEQGICVELTQLVRAGLTCQEAASWMGFGAAMAPIRKLDRCIWPAKSIKHLLGQGYSGELIFEGGAFTARLER